jgi:hypothetical protein
MLFTNFAAGELSETLFGRVDLQQYYQGASKLKNFEIIPTGGIRRRSGLKRIDALKGECRLIPFIVSRDISYVIELGAGYMAFRDEEGVQIAGENGSQLQFTNAGTGVALYTNMSDIREVQYVQNGGVMIFVHKRYPPFVLKYNGSHSFSLGKMAFDFSVDLEVSDPYEKYGISGTRSNGTAAITNIDGDISKYRTSGKSYMLKSGNGEFPAGTRVVSFGNDGTSLTVDKNATGDGVFSFYLLEIDTVLFNDSENYPGCAAFFLGRLVFGGSAREPQRVWASASPNASGNRYDKFSTYKKYITVNKIVKDPDARVFSGYITSASETITGVTRDFTGLDLSKNYYVIGDYIATPSKVVSVTSVTITLDTAPTETKDTRVTMSIQLWQGEAASADDYEYETEEDDITTADSAFTFEIASDKNDGIRWMTNLTHLVIGTETGEWIVPNTVSAVSIQAVLQSRNGSDMIQATCAGNAVIFFGAGRKSIKTFNFSQDDSVVNNLALFAGQMVRESAAVDFDYVSEPYTRLIVTREDGTAALLLYEPQAGIAGWSRLESGSGEIMSAAALPGVNGYDNIYVVVRDGTAHYIEWLDEEGELYLDGWKAYAGSRDGYGSGAVLFDKTTGKIVAEAETGHETYIGYRYESRLQSMPVVSEQARANKRIIAVLFRFLRAALPDISSSPHTSRETITGKEEPFTGVVRVPFPGTHDRDVMFIAALDKPAGCTVLSIDAEIA